MTATDKRAALIEALGHAICIADLKERIAATVDAIVAIVDERVVGLREIEAEGGGADAAPARLDADRTAQPKTRIVAHVPPGKAAWPHNVERYELKDNDAPREDGEGPDVWVEIDRHGKPAQVNDHKPGHGWEHDPNGRAVRYVPAAAAERRIAELERDKRTAEHQRDVLSRNLARIEDERDEYKREWESACERLRADPHNTKAWQEEGQRQRERIAELESSRDAEINRRCAEYTAEHDRQCRATQERIAELEAERSIGDGPRLFVNFNAQGAAIDVFHDRGEAERRPGHGDVREYVPAASVVGLKAQLIAAFVPEGDREACAAHPLARVVQHAIEHHRWHHDAQDSAYVARVEAERDAAVKRAEEAHRDAKAMWQELADTKRDLEQARAALERARAALWADPGALAVVEAVIGTAPARLDADREEERVKCSRCGDRGGPCEACGIPETPRDWPAFWRSLTPREMWEATKAMPTKLAGPWKLDASGKHAHRITADGIWVCTHDVERDYIEMHAIVAPGEYPNYPDRASADAALREAGWALVDEEPSR